MTEIRTLTPQDVYKLTSNLADILRDTGDDFDLLVGVGRGGSHVGALLAQMMSIENFQMTPQTTPTLTIESAVLELEGRCYLKKVVDAATSVLVVDDIVDTGETMQGIKKRFQHTPTFMTYASLICKMHKAPLAAWPDYYVSGIEEPTFVHFP